MPDNDNHSHKLGPDSQVAAIAQADRQLARLFEAAGGADPFLEDHAVIVVADHAHTLIERSVSLGSQFAGFDVRRPTDMRLLEPAQIAICPAQRAAMIYVFAPSMLARVTARAQRIDGVDHVIWREGEEAVVARGGAQLRFAPGEQLADLRGRRWTFSGAAEVLDLRVRHGVVRSGEFPDALARVWDATACEPAGEVLLTAAAGVEFTDWGGAGHIGGGSHGSLCAGDSNVPLICCGLEGELNRAQWSIADVAPLITRHFGLD